MMSTNARGVLTALLVAGTANLALAQQAPIGNPNSKKYSVTGARPATGRAGSATLEARALLSKGGALQVEASTGSLENGTNPGNIDKVQLKTFPNGATAVSNFNNLKGGGYWTGTFAGVSRGDQVQVQTNITGIDPKRTDVITLSTNAALRPDIAVASVTGPAQATPQSSVGFQATVTEKNGDVGARTNCVLSIGGTNVDAAEGIWVDAAGTVSCAFSHVFATPGTYAVKVTAANVNPGDWDLANNAADTSIVIIEPGKPLTNGYMGAGHMDRQWEDHVRAISGPDYRYDSNGAEKYSWAYLHGWMRGSAAAMQRADVSLSADGMLQHSVSLTPNSGYDYNGSYSFSRCRSFYPQYQYTSDRNGNYSYSMTGDWAQMCTYGEVGSDPSTHHTWAFYQRLTGNAVYYSKGSYYGNTWFYNHNYTYGNGQDLGWKLGTEVRLKLSFVDAVGTAVTADQSVKLLDDSQWVNYSSQGTYYDSYFGRWIEYWYKRSGKYFSNWKSWQQ